MLKIMFINPVGTGGYDKQMQDVIRKVKRTDVEVTVTHLSKGPVHLEYHSYEHLIMQELLHQIRRAETEGYSAAIIGCFYDTGLREARELVSIPVIAPGETCMHVAAMLGHKFSIIVGRRKCIPKIESNLHSYGLGSRLASFRDIGFEAKTMAAEPERMNKAILREAKKATEEDGAEVITLGCTLMSGSTKELSERLKIPVLDPVVVPWKFAEMLSDLYSKTGLSHSRIYGYEPPPKEEGWLKLI
jgi:allantoin racemase